MQLFTWLFQAAWVLSVVCQQIALNGETHDPRGEVRWGLRLPHGRRGPSVRSEDLSIQNAARTPLRTFELYKPLNVPDYATNVERVLLLNHSFGNSYGQPFVGYYSPAEKSFTNVHINITVNSKGRQFDRLAILYLGDVEVFRTSTAEPTIDGITWSYTKDMTQYRTLWQRPQKVIFDLGNLINNIYTAPFNVTIEATFFVHHKPPQPPLLILPISAGRSTKDQPSAFSVPRDNATVMHRIPANFRRAIVSIAACGQASEEFWYSNVPSNLAKTFSNTTGDLGEYSSFREVQLLIDGELAGVVWPHPTIFTGGIAPGLWRPEVGLDAFDLREQEIDITPYLPYLQNSKKHQFEIRVLGIAEEHGRATVEATIGDYWVVTGKIFLFAGDLGPEASQKPLSVHNSVTNLSPIALSPDPSISILNTVTQTSNGTNSSLTSFITVRRSLRISSGAGIWTQSLFSSSSNSLERFGLSQITQHNSLSRSQAFYGAEDGNMAAQADWGIASPSSLKVVTNITIFGRNPEADTGSGIGISAAVERTILSWAEGVRQDVSPWTLNPFSTPPQPYNRPYPVWVDELCTRDDVISKACKKMYDTGFHRDEVSHVYHPFGFFTTQRGSAKYSSQKNHSYSFGNTDQTFLELSRGDNEWVREVWAVNGSIQLDEGSGESVGIK